MINLCNCYCVYYHRFLCYKIQELRSYTT